MNGQHEGHTRKKRGGLMTDPKYWDCACKDNYIHRKSERLQCTYCGATEDEMPDARTEEIKHYKETN